MSIWGYCQINGAGRFDKMNEIIKHYDALIKENNDPVHDPLPLKEYMDKWDGQKFIDCLQLSSSKDIMEIGIGTGRLAIKVCGNCNTFTGIDISPQTIDRAIKNLRDFDNISLICADFIDYSFGKKFDVIYSSLTFIHIQDKKAAIDKVSTLLKTNGRFVLSISKSQDKFLEVNSRKIELFPAMLEEIKGIFNKAELAVDDLFETELAFVFVAIKNR